MKEANQEVLDAADDDAADDAGDSERGSDRDTSSSKSDRGTPGKNAFAAVRAKMGDTLRGDGADDDDDGSDQIEEDEDDVEDRAAATDEDDEAEGDEDGSDQDEDLETPGKKKGKAQADGADDDEDADDDDDESSPRYEIVDEAGEKYDVDLPKGARIRFAGDGKKIEISKFSDLVALAQKGTAFDRVSSTAGQVRSNLEKRINTMLSEREADEDLLVRLAFDELTDEDKENLQKALEPYRDPTARKGLRKVAEDEERTKAESLQAEQTQKEAAVTFWSHVDETIGSELKQFEYLDSEDADEIKTRFYGAYTTRLAELTPEYERAAPTHGLSKEQALAIAQRDAAKVLTEKTLRKVMKQLDEKYAKRAGRGRDDVAERKGKREAEKHNTRVEAKRAQRHDPRHRSLRSGGAPVRGGESTREKVNKPVGFENRITGALRKMRRSLREADAE